MNSIFYGQYSRPLDFGGYFALGGNDIRVREFQLRHCRRPPTWPAGLTLGIESDIKDEMRKMRNLGLSKVLSNVTYVI